MTHNNEPDIGGGTTPELVPVVGGQAVSLALVRPEPGEFASADDVAFGDLLSDALFGEIIDISDLIQQVMSPAAAASQLPPVEVTESSQVVGGDIPATTSHGLSLTILYDDDILASGHAIL
jgi:hypothetical protein